MWQESIPNGSQELAAAARQWRSELLAVADGEALTALAERCLVDGESRVADGPAVGTVPLTVREPVVGERFILAEVLATKVEVDHRGVRGWAIRLGDDATATVAAAICDAEAVTGSDLTADIERLCLETERSMQAASVAEWAELAPTEVKFEELS